MSVYKTLFGQIFLKYQSKCGCINYSCSNFKKCSQVKLPANGLKKYSELFFLNNNFTGKFDYKYLNKYEIDSKITIFNPELTTMFKEKFSTIKEPYYKLQINSQQITFDDLPKEFLEIIKRKEIILPKN